VRYRNKKGRRPKRYKRSDPQRKPIRCSWWLSERRKCRNPGQWLVRPLEAGGPERMQKAVCRMHIVNVFNRYKKNGGKVAKFYVERIPEWRSVRELEET